MWPTPSAALHNDAEQPETFEARRAALKAKGINGNGAGTPLTMAVKMWPTPAARDHKGANGEDHLANGTGRLHLDQLPNYVAHLWESSLPAPETPTHGDPSSPSAPTSRRQLNPAFVEWLMGWPEGWTDFGCSETALCLYRQRMRFALLSLGSRGEAPAQQLSLI